MNHSPQQYVDLWYPDRDAPQETFVNIQLMDVRAADDLTVTYDFIRDGYVLTMNHKEVGFVGAWAGGDPEEQGPFG